MDHIMINGYARNMWNKFKACLDKIFNREEVSRAELMTANRIIFDSIQTSVVLGAQFYKSIYWYLALHCSKIAHQANENYRENLLEFYRREWVHFRSSCKRLHIATSHLVPNWTQHHYALLQLTDQPRNIYDTKQLPIIIWKRMVYNLLPLNLTKLLIEEIRQERLGATINRQLIAEIINTYIEIGLEDDNRLHRKASMNVYIADFEEPFLREMEDFYEKERAEYLKEDNLAGFQEEMKQREIEEKERAEEILPKESLVKVLNVLTRIKNQQ